MKYAKKMKLVECREESTPTIPDKLEVSDSFFIQPKIIQSLDKSMSEILFNKNMADNQKWALYNQTLHRYLHFTRQHNPQYTSKVKSPNDYTMFLNESQQSVPVTSRMINTSQPSMSTHNATQQSINSHHTLNTTQPSIDISSNLFNTSIPTLQTSGDETMYSINDADLNTPVRNFFHTARTSNANEHPSTQSTNAFQVIPEPFVRLTDIGPIARNTRSKRRAYHLDNTIPSPAVRKKRKNRRGGSQDRTIQRRETGQMGGLLKNWISFRMG